MLCSSAANGSSSGISGNGSAKANLYLDWHFRFVPPETLMYSFNINVQTRFDRSHNMNCSALLRGGDEAFLVVTVSLDVYARGGSSTDITSIFGFISNNRNILHELIFTDIVVINIF